MHTVCRLHWSGCLYSVSKHEGALSQVQGLCTEESDCYGERQSRFSLCVCACSPWLMQLHFALITEMINPSSSACILISHLNILIIIMWLLVHPGCKSLLADQKYVCNIFSLISAVFGFVSHSVRVISPRALNEFLECAVRNNVFQRCSAAWSLLPITIL